MYPQSALNAALLGLGADTSPPPLLPPSFSSAPWFFYVPWRKAFLIAGCLLCYMILVAVGIYRAGVSEEKPDEGLILEDFLKMKGFEG